MAAKKSRFNAKYQDLLIMKGVNPEELPQELKGNPVHIPQVNFDVPLEEEVRAKMGPPPYAVRARLVEDLVEKLFDELFEQYKKVAQSCQDDTQKFAKIWTAIVETLELDEINGLITEHNRFYPIEANLREHPDTGKIMIGNTPWKPKKKITPPMLLEKFPAELEAALKSEERDISIVGP